MCSVNFLFHSSAHPRTLHSFPTRRSSDLQNPGVFDYRRHLERQGIYWTGTIRNPRLITILDRGWHGPDRIKKWIDGRIEAPFTSDNDVSGNPNIPGLVAGMVLGRTYDLTEE